MPRRPPPPTPNPDHYPSTLSGLRDYLEARRDTLEVQYLETGDLRLPFANAVLGDVLRFLDRLEANGR